MIYLLLSVAFASFFGGISFVLCLTTFTLYQRNKYLEGTVHELIDKFVHNKIPARLLPLPLAGQKQKVPGDVETDDSEMGDPLSIAERQAYQDSKPKTDG